MKHIITLLFFLAYVTMFSQEIKGVILDNNSKLPLDGVSVYFNGTTVGTITNAEGFFNINYEPSSNAVLVVSFLGYETRVYSLEEIKDLNVILLEEKLTDLDEVELEIDNWSREKKISIFKREFLGNDVASSSCKILNEDDIRLTYIESEQALYASCNKPIIIENKYLGYKINYDLADFEIKFKQSLNGFRLTEMVYYSGTSIFQELYKKTKKKHKKERQKVYLGSVLHFMRSLSQKRILENNFEIFIKDISGKSNLFFPVNPYSNLLVEEQDNQNIKLTIKVKNITILYNKIDQSSLSVNEKMDSFFIDKQGIHSPSDRLYFGGDFGIKRISIMLPSNFTL